MTTVLRCRATSIVKERPDTDEALWFFEPTDDAVRCELAAGHGGRHSAFLNQLSDQAFIATRDEGVEGELHAYWEDGREAVAVLVHGCDTAQFFYDHFPDHHDSWFPGCSLPKGHVGPHSDPFGWWQDREVDDLPTGMVP